MGGPLNTVCVIEMKALDLGRNEGDPGLLLMSLRSLKRWTWFLRYSFEEALFALE